MTRVQSLVLPLVPSLVCGAALYALWRTPPGQLSPVPTAFERSGGVHAGGGGNRELLEPPPVLSGSYENIAGVEFVWQVPSARPPVGVLLLCHGCEHGALDWWPATVGSSGGASAGGSAGDAGHGPGHGPGQGSGGGGGSNGGGSGSGGSGGNGCPRCAGLPVETGLAAAGLARGWAVVAVSPRDKAEKCWRERHDLRALGQAVAFVRKQAGLMEGSALAALGFGSGGRLVSLLDGHGGSGLRGLVGVVVVASLSGKDPHAVTPSGHWAPSSHAPVRFLYFSRDASRAAAVEKQAADLRRLGLDAAGLAVHALPLAPESFLPRGLATGAALPPAAAGGGSSSGGGRGGSSSSSSGGGGRGGGTGALPTAELAARAVALLGAGGLLDGGGVLKADPRGRGAGAVWREALRPLLAEAAAVEQQAAGAAATADKGQGRKRLGRWGGTWVQQQPSQPSQPQSQQQRGGEVGGRDVSKSTADRVEERVEAALAEAHGVHALTDAHLALWLDWLDEARAAAAATAAGRAEQPAPR